MSFAPVLLLLLFKEISTLKLSEILDYEIKLEYSWNVITFENKQENENELKEIKCESCMPAGIKLSSNGTIFTSFPRWKSNVFATFAVLNKTSNNFIPWPSEKENTIGDAQNFRSVLGFEIDLDDNIYILDQGKIDNEEAIPKSMKLMKYSMDGKLIHSYDLSDFADSKGSFLNDVVIDPKRGIAYISDSGISINEELYQGKPGIIVLYLNNTESTKAYRILDGHYSVKPDSTYWLNVNNEKVKENEPMSTGVDGIAWSCDYEIIYYTPLSSRMWYTIFTEDIFAMIRSETNGKELKVNSGYKNTSSDGILASGDGHLYMTAWETNSIFVEKYINDDLSKLNYKNMKIFNGTNATMWPDTLAIHNKTLYFISNQLNNYVSDHISYDKPKYNNGNYRIYSIYINDFSYLEGCKFFKMNWSFGTIMIWIIFAVIILVVLSFVLMSSHRQEDVVDKHMSIGISQDDHEIENDN